MRQKHRRNQTEAPKLIKLLARPHQKRNSQNVLPLSANHKQTNPHLFQSYRIQSTQRCLCMSSLYSLFIHDTFQRYHTVYSHTVQYASSYISLTLEKHVSVNLVCIPFVSETNDLGSIMYTTVIFLQVA